jgi:tRNA-splicing ligase RtcB (3'-phosphate/5'-hydroxy nucleic acid ligase)
MINIHNPPTPIIEELLKDISSLPQYKGHITLPDLHYKAQMEAPSSTAINTGRYIIPSLASAAINDGMSIIRVPLPKEKMKTKLIKEYFGLINVHASRNKLSMNKYSLTQDELISVLINGAEAVIEKFNLDKSVLNSIENKGKLNISISEDDIRRLVPRRLLVSRFGRAEFGLNFRGNHFLELQYVSKIMSPPPANVPEISENDLMIMTHLGPGPFTGNLLRIYSNREKIGFLHRQLYLLAKLYFHLFASRRGNLSLQEICRYYFNPEKYQAFSIDSPLGKDFELLLQMGTNYGYAYQMGTFAAIRDATQLMQKKYSLPQKEIEMLWNVSHNSIYKEPMGEKEQIITRHNSVKMYQGKPTIIAGSYNTPSLIGISQKENNNSLMNTHDHGIGAILERLKLESELNETDQDSIRFYFKRGTFNKIEREIKSKIFDDSIISEIGRFYAQQKIMTPWLHLQPIATLKN